MFYYAIALLISVLIDVLTVTFTFKADKDKDLEIMVLRHQLRILQRKVDKVPRLSRPEKLLLAVITDKFKIGVKVFGAV